MSNSERETTKRKDVEPASAKQESGSYGGGTYGSSYTPIRESEPQMTAAQYQNQQEFYFSQVERFKKMFEDSTLAKYIIAAGIGGGVVAVVEVLRAFIELIAYSRK